MKNLLLQNLYTGGHRVKEVKDDFPVKIGQVVSFDGDITDKDYKLYKVKNIEMKKVLKCGCVRGYKYCPEAKRLWNLFCKEYQKIMTTTKKLDHRKAKRLFQDHENHFM